MLKRTLQTLVVVLGLIPAMAMGQEENQILAQRLPAETTAVYAEMDVGRALEEARNALAFIDADAGEKIVYQVENLYGLLRELAAGHEFRPTLFDSVVDTRLYFVLMAKDEPEEIVQTFKMPKFDEETGDVIAGEFEEETYTSRKNFTSSFVVRVPGEDVAADFMAELKAMLDRQKEAHPGSEEFDRRDIEVEMGELIGEVEGESTVGRLGEYIIFSDSNPRELWAALMVAPEESVSDTAMYKRLVEGRHRPQGFIIVNTRPLIRRLEADLKRSLDEVEKEYAEKQGQTGGDDWQIQMGLEMARGFYKTFLAVNKLLSLDRWEHAGASFFARMTEGSAFSDVRGLFSHGQPISPVLAELLDGSGSFALPPAGKQEGMCVMVRVGLKRIYDEVVSTLRASMPEGMAQFDMGMQMMKMMMGVDVGDILGMLAGDLYLFINVVEKEREVREYTLDEDTQEWRSTTEKKVGPVPEIKLLWGLNDSHAARNMLNTLFTALSTNPQFNQFVKKHTYQGTDVFCFGVDASKPESYPDGFMSFAVIVVERYLSAGSWEYATGLVRRMKSERREVDDELQAIVEEHKDSNFLLVVPKAFQQHFEEMVERAQGADEEAFFDSLLEALESAEFGLDDEELARRIRNALTELLLGLRELQEKADALTPQTVVLSGTHAGGFYEVRTTSDVTK